jgi:magnesium chelatase family protein
MVVMMRTEASNNVNREPIESAQQHTVARAIEAQYGRYHELGGAMRNADLPWQQMSSRMGITRECENHVNRLAHAQKIPMNLRTIHKVLRVARTIADLEAQESVSPDHITEAWELRCRYSPKFSMVF